MSGARHVRGDYDAPSRERRGLGARTTRPAMCRGVARGIVERGLLERGDEQGAGEHAVAWWQKADERPASLLAHDLTGPQRVTVTLDPARLHRAGRLALITPEDEQDRLARGRDRRDGTGRDVAQQGRQRGRVAAVRQRQQLGRACEQALLCLACGEAALTVDDGNGVDDCGEHGVAHDEIYRPGAVHVRHESPRARGASVGLGIARPGGEWGCERRGAACAGGCRSAAMGRRGATQRGWRACATWTVTSERN